MFFPCGAPSYFWPSAAGSGNGWQLPSVLEPLAALKEQVLVLGNVENYSPFNANLGSSVEPSHGRLGGAFLSCVDAMALSRDLSQIGYPKVDANGVTVDQVLAQAVRGFTPIDSLQLGLSTTDSYCDGQPCSLSRCISWAAQTKPLYKLVDPQLVFDAIFGDAILPGAPKNRRDRSVLDAVLASSRALDGKLSQRDRQTLEQYLSSIRDTENAIVDVSGCGALPTRPTFTAPRGSKNGVAGYDRDLHANVMNQLIALAFQCDATRVISFMFEDERSEFVYDHVPVRDFTPTTSTQRASGERCAEFHATGQTSSGEANDFWSSMCWWHSLKVADLCQKLASFPEGAGSVLDNTIVLYGSGMHGQDHSAANLPLALIGGRTMLKSDRFHAFPSPQPLRDLHYTLLNGCFAAGVENFGDNRSGAPHRLLSELLA